MSVVVLISYQKPGYSQPDIRKYRGSNTYKDIRNFVNQQHQLSEFLIKYEFLSNKITITDDDDLSDAIDRNTNGSLQLYIDAPTGKSCHFL